MISSTTRRETSSASFCPILLGRSSRFFSTSSPFSLRSSLSVPKPLMKWVSLTMRISRMNRTIRIIFADRVPACSACAGEGVKE